MCRSDRPRAAANAPGGQQSEREREIRERHVRRANACMNERAAGRAGGPALCEWDMVLSENTTPHSSRVCVVCVSYGEITGACAAADECVPAGRTDYACILCSAHGTACWSCNSRHLHMCTTWYR